MNERLQQLEQLKALVQAQQAEALTLRVVELEEKVAMLVDLVEALTASLSRLQMDFHREHTRLQ